MGVSDNSMGGDADQVAGLIFGQFAVSALTRMSTTCIVRRASNARALDIGTAAALSVSGFPVFANRLY
jgi:hypothetical protein